MADQLLEQARELFEGQIDFEGQKLIEFLTTVLLVIVGGISFLAGFIRQDIKSALLVGLGGTALTFVAVVPPWPIFNTHPVKWLPVGDQVLNTSEIMVDGQTVS